MVVKLKYILILLQVLKSLYCKVKDKEANLSQGEYKLTKSNVMLALVWILYFLMNTISNNSTSIWEYHKCGMCVISLHSFVLKCLTLHIKSWLAFVCIPLQWKPPPQHQHITHLHLLTCVLYFQLIKLVYLMTTILVEEQQQYVFMKVLFWPYCLLQTVVDFLWCERINSK